MKIKSLAGGSLGKLWVEILSTCGGECEQTRAGRRGGRERKSGGGMQTGQEKERRDLATLGECRERERERGRNGTRQEGERKEGACEWLRVEEGCWYWLWWRWAGRAEEQGAGWIGRRVSG